MAASVLKVQPQVAQACATCGSSPSASRPADIIPVLRSPDLVEKWSVVRTAGARRLPRGMDVRRRFTIRMNGVPDELSETSVWLAKAGDCRGHQPDSHETRRDAAQWGVGKVSGKGRMARACRHRGGPHAPMNQPMRGGPRGSALNRGVASMRRTRRGVDSATPGAAGNRWSTWLEASID